MGQDKIELTENLARFFDSRIKYVKGAPLEYMINDLIARRGGDPKVTPQVGDGGVDLVLDRTALPDDTRALIQVKGHPNSTMSPQEVLNCRNTMLNNTDVHGYEDWDRTVIVTTGSFGSQAPALQDEDEYEDLQLLDCSDIRNMMIEADAYDVLEQRLPSEMSTRSGTQEPSWETVNEKLKEPPT